ncbi:hypothetical protein J3D43_004782 [Paenibacillus xylanexedens]|uniref:RNA-directed DNA polymerase n=1 Tax=Paenibacillus xylanexedens TaxID=528191 RepID=UPI00209EA00F|nr:RNA-directed DNA polymerase [Paenibacillus xylanexedens]MCP1426266.1 hypothetical protein [Paenibacillus xylanexedens]
MLKLKENSIEWALNHINKYNDTYVFPMPFEFDAINENKDEVIKHIKNIDVSSFGLQTYRTEITPKSQVGFRISTQLDPIDSIIYNAVLYEICEVIENVRIPTSEEIVFSYRMKVEEDGTLYDENYDWKRFNDKVYSVCQTGKYSHVVVSDIADFFPSIYLHNIETCLREATAVSGQIEHANALIRLIKGMHISQTHKGLPIGPQFSRPIAELIMHEVDKILIANNIKFVRYVDDIRIFCDSEAEAYRNLSFLAQKYYDLRNLKLNESKTKILKIDNFQKDYLRVFEEEESDRVLDEFYNLCEKIGISLNSYEDIDIYDLDDDDREALEQLNIIELLSEEIEKDIVDLGLIKFLIENLARFDNTEVADIFLEESNIVKIFPVIHSFINYLSRVRSFSESQKHHIGARVLELFNDNFITELQYNRAWLLHLFTKNKEWNNVEKFNELKKKYSDEMTSRELLLCFGRAGIIDYFRENKLKNTMTMPSWERRAFIAAISCLPKDERNAWYVSQSYKNREFLDQIVEKWAKKNYFA